MRRTSFLLLCSAALLASLGCGYRMGYGYYGGGMASGPGWSRVVPPGAGIACSMPGMPRVETTRDVQADGTPSTLTIAASESPNTSFSVMVADFEGGLFGDPLRESEGVVERITGNLELQDRRSVRLDVPGFYAREDTGHTAEGVFFAMRLYIGLRRVYVAFAVTPAVRGGVQAAEQFMASLEIDPADALYPRATEPGSSEGAALAWSPLFMPEDDFAVTMPAISRVTTGPLQVGEATSSMRTYEATAGGASYRVRVLQSESGPLPFQAVSRALELGDASGPYEASGYPGVVVHRDGDASEQAIDSRIVRTASRIYVLEVAGAARSDETAHQFFDSLRIL